MARKRTALALVKPDAAPIRLRLGLDLPIKEENDAYTWVDTLKRYDDASVEHIVAYAYFHRLTREKRYEFVNEACRVLAPTKQLTIIGPYYTSHMAITDPLAEWPPVAEGSFLVYSRAWREANGMEGLPLTCNFGQNFVAGHIPEPDMAPRNEEYRSVASRHWWNSVRELHVTLTKLTT
jgi:hypothetical protein